MSADLEGALHAQIGGIAAAAAAGLGALAVEDDGPAAATGDATPRPGRPWPRSSTTAGPCSVISGRSSVPCGNARPASHSRRWPSMSGLLARATSADARLTVDGNPRTLPAGLELSGYRIVEHLLLALADAPGAPVEVRLHFGPDALELHVSGPPVTQRRRAGRAGGRAGTRPPARRHRG